MTAVKAYLSSDRASGAPIFIASGDYSDVDEARAILAETEPDMGRIGYRPRAWYDRMDAHPCDAHERHNLRAALAESLAAFVNMEGF